MSKKKYSKPILPSMICLKNSAVPLAFFSAATTAAAVVGAVAGAVATSKMMSVTPHEFRGHILPPIKGFIYA